MIVLMNVNGKRYIKELTAANICRMTMAELVEFEKRVWRLMEKSKYPLRAIDVLNAVYREVEWRAQERRSFATHSQRRPRTLAERIS